MNRKIARPNVILIVMDAVRADHLSCYGYQRKTSPNVDDLARKGVLFESAFSTAEWSYPSHASIFTGKYPSYHKTLGKDIYLHEENTTIARILGSNGYLTAGVSCNDLLNPINGFSEGFQKYFLFDVRHDIRSIFRFVKQSPKDLARTLIYGFDGYTYRNIEKIKKLLRNVEKGKPFFLFTNIYNGHAPYNPPRPFKKKFCDSFNRSPLSIMELVFQLVFGHPGGKISNSHLNIRKLNRIADERGHYSFMAKEFQVSEEEWEVVKSWYDGEILYLDYCIGELIEFLQREGIFENTLLIITSDHGENFGEHGLASHQFCLYDSLIHVPLIMTWPDVIPRGRKISSLVSHIDIFPTILNLLRIEGYRDDIQGKSLFPFEDRKIHDFICAECGESVRSRLVDSTLRPKLEAYDKGYKCLRTESYKYVISADQKEELYNVKRDPLEKVNIAGKYPDKRKNFKEQLENTIDLSFFGPREFPAKKGHEEIVKRLETLGYI